MSFRWKIILNFPCLALLFYVLHIHTSSHTYSTHFSSVHTWWTNVADRFKLKLKTDLLHLLYTILVCSFDIRGRCHINNYFVSCHFIIRFGRNCSNVSQFVVVVIVDSVCGSGNFHIYSLWLVVWKGLHA